MKSVLLPHPANIGLASCNTNLCPTLSTVQAKANKLNPKLCQPNHVIINCLARHISVEIVCRTEGNYVFSRFIYNICWVHRSARQPGNYFACKCEKSSPAPPPHRWPRLVLYFVSTQCPPLWGGPQYRWPVQLRVGNTRRQCYGIQNLPPWSTCFTRTSTQKFGGRYPASRGIELKMSEFCLAT